VKAFARIASSLAACLVTVSMLDERYPDGEVRSGSLAERVT
jgi:hypothetical protein